MSLDGKFTLWRVGYDFVIDKLDFAKLKFSEETQKWQLQDKEDVHFYVLR